VTGALLGTCACSRDVARATAVGYHNTGHDTTNHPGASADDMLLAVGADSQARCKPLALGDSESA